MLTSTTISIILNTSFVNREGKHGIYLQFIKNRKPNRFSLKRMVHPNAWLGTPPKFVKVRGKGKHPNGKELNAWLNQIYVQAEKILIEADYAGEQLDFKTFKNRFLGIKKDDFFDFAEIYFKQQKKKGISTDTLENYNKQCRKLRLFQAAIKLQDINENWITNYEGFLRIERKNDINTIYKSLVYVRVVLKTAIKQKAIRDNPFDHYEIKKIDKKVSYLSLADVQRLDRLYDSHTILPMLQNVLQQFLFACVTGCDFGDITRLEYGKEVITVDGHWIIDRGRNKNDSHYIVLLEEWALKFIDVTQKEGLLFRAITNQKTNDYLKQIMRMVGITKKVTFHTARHTFATIYLNNKGTQETLQKILGHKTMKMTQKYGRVLSSTIIEEMQSFNKKIKNKNE